MNETLNQISRIGVVPVMVIDDAKDAMPLAMALAEGGLPIVEITFRTAAAEEAIKEIATQAPDILVGAGTVTTRDQLDRALAAGAKFIVSPGFNPEMVKYGLSKGATMLPGTATGGEMEQAMAMGLEAVKFFPAEENGGVKTLKALSGPYRAIRWVPTGGVNAKNLSDYLALDQVLACGGTWMLKKELVAAKDWSGVTAICKETVRTMLDISLAHVGVNCADPDEAERMAKTVCLLLDLEPRQTSSSWFAGDAIEYMNKAGAGTKGHIGLQTSSVERAMYHLGRRGVVFAEETVRLDNQGRPKFVYLAGEYGGFAIHLVKK